MGTDGTRTARLLAYAVAGCGGAFVCLLLFAGSAQADEAAPDELLGDSALPLDGVGERVAATTRDLGDATGQLARDATPRVRPLAPIVERATVEVEASADQVADTVERLASAADEVVDDPIRPPDRDGPVVDDPEGVPGTTPTGSDRTAPPRERPAASHAEERRTPDRAAPREPRSSHPPASTALALTVAWADVTPDRAVAADNAVSFGLAAGCDDCAATGSPSGDPLQVLGLPDPGVATPSCAATVRRDARATGPVPVGRRPDVSPD